MNLRFFYFKILFFILNQLKKIKDGKKIFIYDIDNTLANTWPYINNRELNPSKLPYFIKIRDQIVDQISNKDLVLFCSVRRIEYYFQTLKWLKNIGIDIKFYQLN